MMESIISDHASPKGMEAPSGTGDLEWLSAEQRSCSVADCTPRYCICSASPSRRLLDGEATNPSASALSNTNLTNVRSTSRSPCKTASHTDPTHPLALRARRERPRRRAAEQCKEEAAPHSITSSARCCRNHGNSSPSSLAVLMLIASSNTVGCSTGRSAGFAPLRILST
jgi:hypothetical protein